MSRLSGDGEGPVDRRRRRTLKFPLSTGQTAQLIISTEPKLAELVRQGHIQPRPDVFAGRRLWHATHVVQAARALGTLTPEIEALHDGSEVPVDASDVLRPSPCPATPPLTGAKDVTHVA